MTASHMGLVFAADGLDGSEKLLLLAFTNYTDPHGYCWPSEARLADDCGTSRSTVQRVKRKLAARGLVKSVRRVNPKTGEPISNLTRVNLPLLESMARDRKVYDDNVVEALTFDVASDLLKGQSESQPQSDTGHESDWGRPRVNLKPTQPQDDAQSLIDPVEIPLSSRVPKSRPTEPSAAPVEEREKSSSPQADTVVAAYVDALGRPMSTTTRGKLHAQAAQLLADGFPVAWLTDRARELAQRGWTDLAQHCDRSTVPVQARPAASKADWCGQCDDPNYRQIRDPARDNELVDCPACNPAALARARRAAEQGAAA